MHAGLDPPLLTRAEFEALKHNPVLILQRATAAIARLRQEAAALTSEHDALQQFIIKEDTDTDTDKEASQRGRDMQRAAAELERDHRLLSVQYTNTEAGNTRLTQNINLLRNEKEELTREHATLKMREATLATQYTDTIAAITVIEKSIPEEVEKIKSLQEAIEKKIASVDTLTKDIVSYTSKTINLQKKLEKLGCERFSLEAETLALEQTTKQQERTINYLQHESMQLDDSINKKTTELVEMKKQMSAVLLEIQLQVTKAEEEMTRLHNTLTNEKNLTGRQNIWQAKELHAKTEDLLNAREEMAREHGKLKSELSILEEKAQRLKNNVFVVEKKNQVLNGTLKQLEEEDEFIKSSYNKRKDEAFEEMTKQGVAVQQLNSELQKIREDLYLMKSKICKDCRTTIFPS